MRDLNYYLGLPYTLEIAPDEDGYFVRVLELPGCQTYADTLEKLWPMVEDAMRDWIKVSLEYGDDIPEPLERSALGAEDGTFGLYPRPYWAFSTFHDIQLSGILPCRQFQLIPDPGPGMHSTNVLASRSSPMSRPSTPDLFESCSTLQPFAHLARRTVFPNTGPHCRASGASLQGEGRRTNIY